MQVSIAFFLNIVRPRNMKFGLNIFFSKNVLDDERIRKNIALQYLKCQSCLLGQLCNTEFLQVSIAFFSNIVRPKNMKFGQNIFFSL